MHLYIVRCVNEKIYGILGLSVNVVYAELISLTIRFTTTGDELFHTFFFSLQMYKNIQIENDTADKVIIKKKRKKKNIFIIRYTVGRGCARRNGNDHCKKASDICRFLAL